MFRGGEGSEVKNTFMEEYGYFQEQPIRKMILFIEWIM